MAWPYLTYAQLHHLQHRWNGCDPRDPERTTPLLAESLSMGPLRRLMQRHLLWWRADVHGGVGLIVDPTRKGFWLQRLDQGLVQARFLGGAGVAVVHTAMLLIGLTHGALWCYLLFWLLLGRVIGAIVHFCGMVEHHQLWRSRDTHLLTQLYATRTISAGRWLNAWMGGLPHHCAHHAFPSIPSECLPLARRRIALALEHHGAPAVPTLPSYREVLIQLIADQNKQAPAWHCGWWQDPYGCRSIRGKTPAHCYRRPTGDCALLVDCWLLRPGPSKGYVSCNASRGSSESKTCGSSRAEGDAITT